MIDSEVFRVYYLVKCLSTIQERRAAMLILKQWPPLYNGVLRRFKRER